jgi:hypothetical protein
MSDSSRPADPPKRVLSATRARQGRIGRHMVWVLVFSTLLAAIGLLLAWTWKAPTVASANSGAGRSSAAKAFDAPGPAPVVPAPGTDHTAPQAP